MNYSETLSSEQVLNLFRQQKEQFGERYALDNIVKFMNVTGEFYPPDTLVEIFLAIADLLPNSGLYDLYKNISWFSLHQAVPDYHLHRRAVDQWWQLGGLRDVSDVRVAKLPNRPRRDRRLRIGIIGADLLSIAHYFDTILAPSLKAFDRDLFAVHLYVAGDTAGDYLQNSVETVRPVGVLDTATWEIASDDLDVLLWPTGFVGHAPFRLLRSRPARRIALWLHTYSTFGPSLADAVVLDQALVTPVNREIQYETLVEVPGPTCLFGVSPRAPDVSRPPKHDTGHIVFGVFNRASKVTLEMVKCWREILMAVPKSRLLLASQSYQAESTRANLSRLLAAAGMDSDRVDVIDGKEDIRDYLALYGRVDIALDTAPFNGGVTTLDALWQGVPIVTLSSREPNGCIGEYMLSYVGRRDLVTTSTQDYVARAIALTDDHAGLDVWRREARERIRISPLIAPGNFSERMAAAFTEVLDCQTGPERAAALAQASIGSPPATAPVDLARRGGRTESQGR